MALPAVGLLTGLTGGVLVNGVAYPFAEWDCNMKCKLITRNNWLNAPYQYLVTGFFDADITLTAPYDAGSMPIAAGNFYIFILQWTPALAIVVGGYVETLKPNNKAEDAPNVSVTIKSHGAFVAAIT